MSFLDYAIVVVYLCGILAVGMFFYKGQKSLKDFFLASRTIPWWAASFSGIATVISAVSFLGAPGQAFKSNLTFLQYRLSMPIAVSVICLVFIPLYYRLQVYSIYQYLENRFDLKNRLFASILFIALKCFYLGLGLFAPSIIISQMLRLPIHWVVLGTATVTVAYTFMGGIKAVIWTDCLQLLVFALGVGAVIYILVSKVDGGLTAIYHTGSAAGKFRYFDFSFSLTNEVTFWSGILGGTFFQLSQYGVDQAEVQRFLTTQSPRKGQLAFVLSLVIVTAYGFLLFLIGVALYVFYAQHPLPAASGISPDRVFAVFILTQLPIGVKGLLIATVLAAAMSSVGAVLNSITTSAISDVYQRLRGRSATVTQARFATVLFGAICTIIALFADRLGGLLVASMKLSNIFAGPIVGLFLLGIISKRASGWGAFLATLTAFAVVLLLSTCTRVAGMWYGFIASIVVLVFGNIYSLFLPAPPLLETEPRIISTKA